jgi:hypothetical protein
MVFWHYRIDRLTGGRYEEGNWAPVEERSRVKGRQLLLYDNVLRQGSELLL